MRHRRRHNNSTSLANLSKHRCRINRIRRRFTTRVSTTGRCPIHNQPVVAQPDTTLVVHIGVACRRILSADHINDLAGIGTDRPQTRGLGFELAGIWVVGEHGHRARREGGLRRTDINQRCRALKACGCQNRRTPICVTHQNAQILILARNHLMRTRLIMALRCLGAAVKDIPDILAHHQLVRPTGSKETVLLAPERHCLGNLDRPTNDLRGGILSARDRRKGACRHIPTDRRVTCCHHGAIDRGLVERIARPGNQDIGAGPRRRCGLGASGRRCDREVFQMPAEERGRPTQDIILTFSTYHHVVAHTGLDVVRASRGRVNPRSRTDQDQIGLAATLGCGRRVEILATPVDIAIHQQA